MQISEDNLFKFSKSLLKTPLVLAGVNFDVEIGMPPSDKVETLVFPYSLSGLVTTHQPKSPFFLIVSLHS